MIQLLEKTMKHNFFSSLIVVAGLAMAFHYCTLSRSSFGCPIIVIFGPPQTKMVFIAMALAGWFTVLILSLC
jgi:hypothetical protein